MQKHSSVHSLINNSQLVDKLARFSKIDFDMECFIAVFSQFSGASVKICFLVGWLGTRHERQVFQEFS